MGLIRFKSSVVMCVEALDGLRCTSRELALVEKKRAVAPLIEKDLDDRMTPMTGRGRTKRERGLLFVGWFLVV